MHCSVLRCGAVCCGVLRYACRAQKSWLQCRRWGCVCLECVHVFEREREGEIVCLYVHVCVCVCLSLYVCVRVCFRNVRVCMCPWCLPRIAVLAPVPP